MGTIRDLIVGYLSKHPEGVDDDELAAGLNLRYRQQANSRCRQLVEEGIIERRSVGGKIRNLWTGSAAVSGSQIAEVTIATSEPWFWEGNVQASVAEFLRTQGYSLVRLADTRSRQRGKDIEAQNDSGALWVTVKGYPKGTLETKPLTQAGHWFKQALFDTVAWRGESPAATLGRALPDFPRYRRLAEKVAWLQPIVRFSFMWVRQDGTVIVVQGGHG